MERLTVNDLNKVCYDPWELCGMDGRCTKGCHEEGGCTGGCKVLKIYRKLAKLEDLQDQGRLLELPCDIGQRVYEVYRFLGEGAWEVDVHKIRLEDLTNIGKTVFLTREEADAELRRLRKG